MNISANQTIAAGKGNCPVGIQSLATYFRKGGWDEHAAYGRKQHLLLWITRGHCRMTIEGIPKGIGVFSAVYLPAGTPFSIELINTFGQVIRFEPDCDIDLPRDARLLKIGNTVAQQEFGAMQDALQTELNNVRPATEHAVSAYVKLIAVWIERQIASDVISPKRTGAENLVAKFCRLIEADHSAGLSGGDYAKKLGVTLTHLTRSCKNVTGMTAGTLLNRRLIHAAKEQLATTRKSVAQISDELGYSTPGNFARMFKQQTGLSPRQHRLIIKIT